MPILWGTYFDSSKCLNNIFQAWNYRFPWSASIRDEWWWTTVCHQRLYGSVLKEECFKTRSCSVFLSCLQKRGGEKSFQQTRGWNRQSITAYSWKQEVCKVEWGKCESLLNSFFCVALGCLALMQRRKDCRAVLWLGLHHLESGIYPQRWITTLLRNLGSKMKSLFTK